MLTSARAIGLQVENRRTFYFSRRIRRKTQTDPRKSAGSAGVRRKT